MRKVFEQIKKHWLINLIVFVVSLIIGAGVFCLVFFLKKRTITAAVDGSAIATVVVLALGVLMWLSYLGTFDMFAFGFKQLGSMMFSKNARRDGQFHEYKENKAKKREDSSYAFVSVIAASLLISISLIVLEIIYHAQF